MLKKIKKQNIDKQSTLESFETLDRYKLINIDDYSKAIKAIDDIINSRESISKTEYGQLARAIARTEKEAQSGAFTINIERVKDKAKTQRSQILKLYKNSKNESYEDTQKLNIEDFKIEKTDSGLYKVAYDSRIGYIKPDKSYSKVRRALGDAIYKYNTKSIQEDRKALISKLHRLFQQAGIPKMRDMTSSIRGYRPITQNGYYIDIYRGDRTSFIIGLSKSNEEYLVKIKEILDSEGIKYWEGLDHFSVDMEKQDIKNESINESTDEELKTGDLVDIYCTGQTRLAPKWFYNMTVDTVYDAYIAFKKENGRRYVVSKRDIIKVKIHNKNESIKESEELKVGDIVNWNNVAWVKINSIHGNKANVSPIHKEDIDSGKFGKEEIVLLNSLRKSNEFTNARKIESVNESTKKYRSVVADDKYTRYKDFFGTRGRKRTLHVKATGETKQFLSGPKKEYKDIKTGQLFYLADGSDVMTDIMGEPYTKFEIITESFEKPLDKEEFKIKVTLSNGKERYYKAKDLQAAKMKFSDLCIRFNNCELLQGDKVLYKQNESIKEDIDKQLSLDYTKYDRIFEYADKEGKSARWVQSELLNNLFADNEKINNPRLTAALERIDAEVAKHETNYRKNVNYIGYELANLKYEEQKKNESLNEDFEEDDYEDTEEMHKEKYVTYFETPEGRQKYTIYYVYTDSTDDSYNELCDKRDNQLGMYSSYKELKDALKERAEKIAKQQGWTVKSIENLGEDDEYYRERNKWESIKEEFFVGNDKYIIVPVSYAYNDIRILDKKTGEFLKDKNGDILKFPTEEECGNYIKSLEESINESLQDVLIKEANKITNRGMLYMPVRKLAAKLMDRVKGTSDEEALKVAKMFFKETKNESISYLKNLQRFLETTINKCL